MNFIFLPENALFLITFALILLFGLVEILAMIFGMSVFSHADTWLSPHIYAGDSLFSQGLFQTLLPIFSPPISHYLCS